MFQAQVAVAAAIGLFTWSSAFSAPKDILVCRIERSSKCEAGNCQAGAPGYPLVIIDRAHRYFLRCEADGFCMGALNAALSEASDLDVIIVKGDDLEARVEKPPQLPQNAPIEALLASKRKRLAYTENVKYGPITVVNAGSCIARDLP